MCIQSNSLALLEVHNVSLRRNKKQEFTCFYAFVGQPLSKQLYIYICVNMITQALTCILSVKINNVHVFKTMITLVRPHVLYTVLASSQVNMKTINVLEQTNYVK